MKKVEIERPDSTTPTRKGKGKEETGELQMKRLALKHLGSYGQAKDSSLMTCLGNLKKDQLAGEGMWTMTLVLNLAKQSGALTANVHNLTRMVQELSTTGNRYSKSSNTGQAVKEKRPEPEKRSYAQVSATTETPDPQNPAKPGRKRKGSAGSIRPPQSQQKIARQSGGTTEPKSDS